MTAVKSGLVLGVKLTVSPVVSENTRFPACEIRLDGCSHSYLRDPGIAAVTYNKGTQIVMLCTAAAAGSPRPRAAHNGGYLRASADQHLLRTVTRFQARRRADRRLGAAES